MPGGRRGDLDRVDVTAALGAFLAFAAQVEQRVVDADRHTDQQDDAVDRVDRGHEVRGQRRTGRSRRRPRTARAAPARAAAISAPNATSRIASVTGRLNISARLKSSPRVSSSALSIDSPPTCSTRTPGCSCWTLAVASSSGWTRLSSVAVLQRDADDQRVLLRRRGSAGRPPRPHRGRASAQSPPPATWWPRPGRALPTCGVISTFSTSWSGKLPDLTMLSARVTSPMSPSLVDSLVPVTAAERETRHDDGHPQRDRPPRMGGTPSCDPDRELSPVCGPGHGGSYPSAPASGRTLPAPARRRCWLRVSAFVKAGTRHHAGSHRVHPGADPTPPWGKPQYRPASTPYRLTERWSNHHPEWASPLSHRRGYATHPD